MVLRESLNPKASLWDLLAFYLHFLREKDDISCATAGKIANAARQTVSHWEAGRLKPSEDHCGALDAYYDTGGLLGFLLHHARTGHDPDWLRTHLELEARATILRIYELALIPGLLQTEAYARVLFTNGGLKNVEGEVAKRMERQRILLKEAPPTLWVLIAEPALLWQVGGAEVMREQLTRLLEQPNVILRVVPLAAGAHLGLTGSFKIMKVAGADLAYTEATGGGRLIQETSEVGVFVDWYDRIGSVALPVEASRDLIASRLESYA